MNDQTMQTQQTLLSLADEFLLQYFVCADQRFKETLILSRLFSMGHSLELYLKANLLNDSGVPPLGHDVVGMLRKLDPNLELSKDEKEAGQKLFSADVTNFDLGIHMEHTEALELYQAQNFLQDLKYYLSKKNHIIFPVRISLVPVNFRYLSLVRSLREKLDHKTEHHDAELLKSVGFLGFESNPAEKIIKAFT